MNDNLSYNPATTDPDYQPGIPPQWNPPTTPPKKQAWWKKPLVLTGAAALLLGLGIGSASAKTETVEVEKRVEVPGPERTVTEEVQVPVTPASCLEYVTLSEQAFTYSGEVMQHMSDAMSAASRFDVATIEEAGAQIEAINPKLSALAPKVNAAKAQCRAS